DLGVKGALLAEAIVGTTPDSPATVPGIVVVGQLFPIASSSTVTTVTGSEAAHHPDRELVVDDDVGAQPAGPLAVVRVVANHAGDFAPALREGRTGDHMRDIGVEGRVTIAGFEAERGGEAVATVERVGEESGVTRRVVD